MGVSSWEEYASKVLRWVSYVGDRMVWEKANELEKLSRRRVDPAVDSTGCGIFEAGPSDDKRSTGIRGRTSKEDKT